MTDEIETAFRTLVAAIRADVTPPPTAPPTSPPRPFFVWVLSRDDPSEPLAVIENEEVADHLGSMPTLVVQKVPVIREPIP